MRIAFLVTDNREADRRYDVLEPYFGSAPTALLSGFAELEKAESGKMKAEEEGSPQVSGFSSQVSSFELHVISCTQQPVAAPEKLASNIWFHSLHVPKWGWLRTGYLGCALALRKKLSEILPDIVHAQGTERECAISAIFSGYRRVLTIHGNLRIIRRQIGFPPFSAMWFQSYLEGLVVPAFDGIVCISEYTKKAVEQEAKRTWVVHNAVDPAFLSLGEERYRKNKTGNLKPERDRHLQVSVLSSQASGRPPVVLVVATVDRRKNQAAFLRALDPLGEKHALLAKFFGKCGDDPYGSDFLKLVAERSWCRYGGVLDREALREEFADAAVLVLPSLEDNCPMVVLEAMAAGVPVVASRVGGIPELIQDGVDGLICDPRDPGSMRSAVQRLLNDRPLAIRLSTEARQRAFEEYRPATIAKKHLAIYSEMLGKGVQFTKTAQDAG